jgi:hypothetical protein
LCARDPRHRRERGGDREETQEPAAGNFHDFRPSEMAAPGCLIVRLNHNSRIVLLLKMDSQIFKNERVQGGRAGKHVGAQFRSDLMSKYLPTTLGLVAMLIASPALANDLVPSEGKRAEGLQLPSSTLPTNLPPTISEVLKLEMLRERGSFDPRTVQWGPNPMDTAVNGSTIDFAALNREGLSRLPLTSEPFSIETVGLPVPLLSFAIAYYQAAFGSEWAAAYRWPEPPPPGSPPGAIGDFGAPITTTGGPNVPPTSSSDNELLQGLNRRAEQLREQMRERGELPGR